MLVAVDIGGTFTDSALLDEAGNIEFEKTPSTPKDFSEGFMQCLSRHGIKLSELQSVVHGTTVVINAVTERRGARVAFVTTEGFRDILLIQRYNREDMYNVKYKKPEPFVPRELQITVPERMSYRGEVMKPLDEAKAADWLSGQLK